MQTFADLGVTGLIEIPPAGTLAGLAKRALPGVEIVAVKTPDDIDAARALIKDARRAQPAGGQPDLAAGRGAGQGHRAVRRLRGRQRCRAPAPRWPASRPCATPPGRRSARRRRGRVAGRGRRPRRPRPAPAATAPRGGAGFIMTESTQPLRPRDRAGPDQPTVRGPARPHPRRRRLPARRVVTNDEICEHIDSSDEWIRERSGIITRGWAGEDETVLDMSEAAARTGAGARRRQPVAARRRPRRHRDPPAPNPVCRSDSDRPARRHPGRRVRHLGRLRRLLLRRRAWPTT